MSRSFRLAALTVGTALTASCGGSGAAEDLVILPRPASIMDTGEVSVIKVSATDLQFNPGKGSVHVSSAAGSLRSGIDLTLDADGLAQTDFSCKLADDPDCVGKIKLTASWTAAGKTANAERDITITVEPLRGACEPGFERSFDVIKSTDADIQLVVSPNVSERVTLTANNREVGVAFYDPSNTFGGFAISRPTFGFGLEEEALGRASIGTLGAVDNPLTQTFTSWDKYPEAVRASYELTSTLELKAAINALATALNVGGILSGGLTGTAGANGPFKLIVTYVRRLARTVVVVTVTPLARYNQTQAGLMDNVAGGTSLGQVDDTISPSDAIPCELKTTVATEKIDFLWVVDDSGSMASSQDAVFTAGAIFASRLTSAGLDWRVAAVTTGYYPDTFNGSFRTWTTNSNVMLDWFKATSASWFGTGGSPTETAFNGMLSFVAQQGPPGGLLPGLVRPDAQLQIIILSDAPDQSLYTSASTLEALKASLQPGQRVVTHGIRCPVNETCGDDPVEQDVYQELAQLTGGVVGDIRVFNAPNPDAAQRARQSETMSVIMRSAIAGAGQQLAGFPIASTIHIAIGNTVGSCVRNDVPRSAENGWDVDPSTGKIIVYGGCAPRPGATMAISYRSFTDTTPEMVVIERDGGMPIDPGGGDGGIGITLIANKPVLYQDINDSISVSARLSGVVPNLGRELQFTTTAGAFRQSDGGMNTMITTLTGPGGIVSVSLVETGALGTATVTASHAPSGATGNLDIEIRKLQQVSHVSTSCGSSTDCTLIGLRGSGYNEVAQVVFRVSDGQDRPAVGIPVTFDAATLPAGATLTPSGVTNDRGEVTTSVQSGSQLGTFAIRAIVIPGSVEGVSPTLAIRGAKPANKQFFLSCLAVNLPAYRAPNPPLTLSSNCTVRVVDRHNNPIGTGVAVSLKTEAGVVVNNVLTAPFNNNNPDEGIGRFIFDTIGGVWPPVDTAPFAADNAQPFPFAREQEPSRTDFSLTRNPRDGLITVMAYVVGEEHFDDGNGNGVYDLGEQFVDQGEPFVDSNDNNVWDPGETIIPELQNGIDNGVWDAPNGVYDSNKLIWADTKILVTNYPEPGEGHLEGTNPGGCPGGVAKGNYTEFRVFLPDHNLNRIAAGSTLSINRVGTKGTVTWEPNAVVDDAYGFQYKRALVDASSGAECGNGSTRCFWKTLFGQWAGGEVSKLRVAGAATSDITPCENTSLAAQGTVLGATVSTFFVGFGVQ